MVSFQIQNFKLAKKTNVKPLLHPIIHVHTRKCAANTVKNVNVAW